MIRKAHNEVAGRGGALLSMAVDGKVSTESLTFLIGISIGVLAMLVDMEYPYRGAGNLAAGTSVACFTPTVVKRILFETVDELDPYTAMLDKMLVPIGVIAMVVSVAIVCVGIQRETGWIVIGVGGFIIVLYSIVLTIGAFVHVKVVKEEDKPAGQQPDQSAAVAPASNGGGNI